MRDARAAIFNTDDVMCVDQNLVDQLKRRAVTEPTGRFRLCLHHSTSETVQQMIIAYRRASYIRPHRQDASKLYVMLEGEFLVLLFDDQGNVTDRITLKHNDRSAPFSVRLVPGCWHTTFALSEIAVVCEILGAPNPDGKANQHPDWAPDEDDPQVVARYLNQLELTQEFD